MSLSAGESCERWSSLRPDQFEHVVAAAANVTGQHEFVVIGSQAILGSYAQPPEAMLQSMEADIYPLRDPGGADLIDAALGDGSQFHVAYGYYAHGVGPETAKAPSGWRARLVKRDVPRRPGSEGTIVAWCLEVHDLVLSKCAAGRDRDWHYAREALRAHIVDPDVLLVRVPDLPVSDQVIAHVDTMLRAVIAAEKAASGNS